MSFPLEAPIVCEQVFSKKSMGFLWSMRNELDQGQIPHLDAMFKGKRKGNIQGCFTSTYKLANSAIGRLGYGRLYGSKGSMEQLEREIRGTLCKEFYHDIDVVNCHPVLLIQFAKRYYNMEMPEVIKYCENRTEYLSKISEDKEVAKTAVITIMYGGKNTYPILEPFCQEVRVFTLTVMDDARYADLLREVVKQGGNIGGKFLSYVLQTEERRVMMAMRKAYMERGWSVDVLAYDGVQPRQERGKVITSSLLREVEQCIIQDTEYVVQLAQKPFQSYNVPENASEVAPKVSRDLYLERKALFEENHFYYSPSNTIGEFKNNHLMFYDIQHAKTYLNTFDFKHGKSLKDRTSFIDLWLNDDSRRSIRLIDQKPSDDPEVFSPPLVFRYNQFEESDEKAVSMFQEFMGVLLNHDDVVIDYVTKWIAHIIQHPFVNPLTCILLSGRKGCGKDTLGDFLQEWIIGDGLCHNYTSTTQFWDNYDCDRQGKLLVKLEEASGYLNRKHVGDLKARVTSRTNTINPKGKGSITSANYNRYLMTLNEGEGVKSEEGERRFLTVACGSEWVGKLDQWGLVRKTLFTPAGARAVGDWLMKQDLTAFQVHQLPKTEHMDMLMEVAKSPFDLFLGDLDAGSYGGDALRKLYSEYITNHNLSGHMNQTQFGRALIIPVRDGILLKERKAEGIVYIKK